MVVMAIKVGITGLPGAGKTQTLVRVTEMLEAEGVVVGGMITQPIMENNTRKGFHIMNWLTKKKAVLAKEGVESKVTVGNYGVDIKALENVGVEAIREATEKAEIIIIDEVGKM